MRMRFKQTRVAGLRAAAVSALMLFFIAPPGLASQSEGAIAGRVTDQFGAVIVGADVMVTAADGAERKATSDAAGRYIISGLSPGAYTVRIEAKGFAPFERGELEVLAGRRREQDAQLLVGLDRQEVTVGAGESLSPEAGRNASALVLRETELEALPEDPEELAAALQALSGPQVGPNGGQILIDGFLNTGEPLPPRSSIREVRINENPFSAENDRLGFGQIQIITRPGTDKLRGQAYFTFNDESLNSRNPFARERAPYQLRSYGGNLSGPIIRGRASFFLSLDRRETADNSLINAIVLDESLRAVPYVNIVLVPRRQLNASTRGDFQLSKNQTLTARYNYYRNRTENAGVGGILLPERAFGFTLPIHNLQLTETAVISARVLNEFRLQYIGEDQIDEPVSFQPAINVLGAFASGGSTSGRATNPEGRLTAQDAVLWTKGAHTLRVGARWRRTTITDISPDDFGGTFTFAGGLAPQLDASGNLLRDRNGQPILSSITSIERYRRTLLFLQRGLAPAEIRARGGGATQLTLGGGNPRAIASQVDFGAYLQDDWRWRENFSLNVGLRYEFQTNINRRLNLAPRLAFAWSPDFKRGTSGSQPRTVIRGGIGLFFDRFNENQVLIANKYAAGDFFRLIITDAGVLDQFPVPPPAESLRGTNAATQTVFRRAENLRAPYMLQTAIGIERQLPLKSSFTATYVAARTLHALRARNINAPFTVRDSSGMILSRARPFGETGNIFQYESSGRLNQNQLVLTLNNRFSRRVSFFANYALSRSMGDTEGVGTFPADSYDLRREYGRSALDMRHSFSAGGSFEVPWGLRMSPLVFAASGRPFNITTGVDTNGDAIFADRPALATDSTQPSVRVTPFGAFDLAPAPGQSIIQRNFGASPGYFVVNLEASRAFSLRRAGRRPATTQPETRESSAGARASERAYRLMLGVRILNLLNRVNLNPLVGDLSSPFFGQATATSGGFGSGSVGNAAAGNRRVEVQLRFEF